MRGTPDGENPGAARVPRRQVDWSFALRYEVPVLLLALYVRDVLNLRVAVLPALPPLEPSVDAREDRVPELSRHAVQEQWNRWWEELLSAPQAAVDLESDLRSLPGLLSRAELADAIGEIGGEALAWLAERADEARLLRASGVMVDGGHGALLSSIFSDVRPAEPRRFSFAVTELSVAGDAAIELSKTHFVVSRQFACNIPVFETWLRRVLEDWADELRA